jgi:hypothetical protein
MKTLHSTLYLIFAVCACNKEPSPRPAALPDNVVSDKPIVLKEGQVVILTKEGDRDLMICASVLNGKLSVAEIDPKGRNFEVTWKDPESWETSTEVSDGSIHTFVLDKNGDGYADLRAETTPSGIKRSELKDDKWVELKSENK